MYDGRRTARSTGDGIMIISVIVYMFTNYLGMLLIYLTADFFFDESEGVMLMLN